MILVNFPVTYTQRVRDGTLRNLARDYVCIKMWAELRNLEVEVPVGFLATLGFSPHREGRYLKR